jgi:hypothetical protein
MKLAILLPILLITIKTNAQQLILKEGFKSQYIQEAVLPVANNAYVTLKDSTAYLYNTNGAIPYNRQKLSDIYIVSKLEKKLYSIALLPQYFDQIDEETEAITTLVTYVHEVNFPTVETTKIDALVQQYGYFIPKIAVSEMFSFNESLNIEETYSYSNHQDMHASLPSHYLRLDKNNILAVHANGDLVLTEVKNHKVSKEQKWNNFNGEISIINSIKIGDFARINFQRYIKESDRLDNFWSIINLKTQTFVPIDLKDFNANLEKLQPTDAALLNNIPFFYKAENDSNITLFVLPNKNFVWLDDDSYYYGSEDLSKYATMQEEDKSYSLKVHSYLFNYPSRILRAIAPQEKDKIRALEETYVRNKHEITSQRCKD